MNASGAGGHGWAPMNSDSLSADGDGGDGCVCTCVRACVCARACMRACARVCARACMHACVCACVMCLLCTITYLTQADNNN